MSAPDFPHRSSSRSLHAWFPGAADDQTLFARFVKGLAEQCSHRLGHVAFFNRAVGTWLGSRGRWLHDRRNYGLSRPAYSYFFTRKKMTRAFAFLFAAVVMLGGAG